jgi:hypothetical protein
MLALWKEATEGDGREQKAAHNHEASRRGGLESVAQSLEALQQGGARRRCGFLSHLSSRKATVRIVSQAATQLIV